MSEKAEDATLNEQVLRASDIRETVGLSYRQLNDWESKGVLPSKKRLIISSTLSNLCVSLE
jgi:hypothetical protein